MQHASQTIAAALNASATDSTTSRATTSPETGFPIAWTSALFKRFQAIYGPRFTSRIDGIEQMAISEWSLALDGLNGDQIKLGLERCVTRKLQPGEEDWPPTPREFRALCLPEKTLHYHRDYIALPRPPQDPNMVERCLAKMRALVK